MKWKLTELKVDISRFKMLPGYFNLSFSVTDGRAGGKIEGYRNKDTHFPAF